MTSFFDAEGIGQESPTPVRNGNISSVAVRQYLDKVQFCVDGGEVVLKLRKHTLSERNPDLFNKKSNFSWISGVPRLDSRCKNGDIFN